MGFWSKLFGRSAPQAVAPPPPAASPTPRSPSDELAQALLAPLAEGSPDAVLRGFASDEAQALRERLAALDPSGLLQVLKRWELAHPDAAVVQLALARHYDAMRETSAARSLLEKLRDHPDFGVEALERLGRLAERAGDLRAAAQAYQSALVRDWERPGLRETCLRLRDAEEDRPVAPLALLTHQAPPGLRLEYRLGRGGYGTVYRAWDTVFERPLAVKFLHEHLRSDASAVAAFFDEARLMAGLDLPGVLAIADLDREACWLVLELAEGGSLAGRIAKRPLALGAALRCMDELCSVLAAIHDRGVVHGDIKPQNILFRAGGELVLGDFGVAALARHDVQAQSSAYCPTEPQVANEPSRDLYAAGLVFAEMLTATPPSGASGHAAHCAAAVTEVAPPLGPRLARMLRWLCAERREERLGNARYAASLFACCELVLGSETGALAALDELLAGAPNA